MAQDRKLRYWLPVMLALLLATVFAMAGAKDRAMDVSHEGKILLVSNHKLDDEIITPGRYSLVHRALDKGHVVEFTSLDRPQSTFSIPVRCVLEDSGRKIQHTQVHAVAEDEMRRIVKIRVENNNAAYVFGR